MFFIVTSPVNRQYDAMWEVQWAVEGCKVIKTRHKGLFLIEASRDAAQKIQEYETTAVYRIIPLDILIPAELSQIENTVVGLCEEKLPPQHSFAVRCKRRGFPVSSKDIEKRVGAAVVEACSNPVNLDDPDVLVLIEIIGKKAGIAVLPQSEIVRKEVIDF
ncbi:MAG: RNA-binding protein [Theionarchaea archaeon]|nr:RNA-binding protein [Theionarchaea archaeon]